MESAPSRVLIRVRTYTTGLKCMSFKRLLRRERSGRKHTVQKPWSPSLFFVRREVLRKKVGEKSILQGWWP